MCFAHIKNLVGCQ